MRHVRALTLAGLILLLLAAGAHGSTYLVLPFENQTKNANLEWMGESFAEAFSERLVGPNTYVATRDERFAAFDRLGIPASSTLSRATTIKLAETMDAEYIVIGQYALPSPDQLRVTAEVIEMRTLRLSQKFTEEGALRDLLGIQDRLAVRIAHAYNAIDPAMPSIPAAEVRLDAWENYIRGLAAPSPQARIQYFREAVRLEPELVRAALQLGKLYLQNRDYATAVPWLAKLKPDAPNYLEARFLLGICHFLLEDYEKAEGDFQTVLKELPLNEVVNNLAAAQSRRNRRAALDNFRKAEESDPTDPDYAFNVGFSFWKTGQYANAAKRLRQVLERRPNDAEARALLVRALEKSGAGPEAAKERDVLARSPASSRYLDADDSVFQELERIKRNYDEPNFRQLQMALQTLTEQSLARLPREKHAEVHLGRGRELFLVQNDAEALPELQEAATLDPRNADAHLLLARLHERNGRAEEAIREAGAALQINDSVDVHLLLAKIYLQQNKLAEARSEARLALQLEPQSVAAQSVLKTVEMRSDARPAEPRP